MPDLIYLGAAGFRLGDPEGAPLLVVMEPAGCLNLT